jgi:uncharacterized protein
MSKHVVLLKNKRKGTLTTNLLSQHIEHLKRLKTKGQLQLCGPFTDDSGAFLLIQAASIQEAEALVKQDPFITNKYYESYEVHELIESNESNNWLQDDQQTKGNIKSNAV